MALLTHDAYQAELRRHTLALSMNPVTGYSLNAGIAIGTFTFVRPGIFLLPGASSRHYGTYEMAEAIAELFQIERVQDDVYIPFSNGGYEQDFLSGYGVCPGRLEALIAEARRAEQDSAMSAPYGG